jgi:hypothetical protein
MRSLLEFLELKSLGSMGTVNPLSQLVTLAPYLRCSQRKGSAYWIWQKTYRGLALGRSSTSPIGHPRNREPKNNCTTEMHYLSIVHC